MSLMSEPTQGSPREGESSSSSDSLPAAGDDQQQVNVDTKNENRKKVTKSGRVQSSKKPVKRSPTQISDSDKHLSISEFTTNARKGSITRQGTKRCNTEKGDETSVRKGTRSLAINIVKICAWGDGMHGKLGLGNADQIKFPLEVMFSGDTDERVMTVVGGSHNTAILTNKSVYLTGVSKSSHESSLFGDVTLTRSLEFREVYTNTKGDIKQIAVGNYHAVVLTKEGYALTWGWGGLGQLGHGDNLNQDAPKRVQIKCVKQINAGTTFTMLVTEFGELYAFGANTQGQLGVGSTDNQNTPNKVRRLFNVQTVACGISHSVAVTGTGSDTSTYIWGQIKAGSIEPVPIEVKSLKGKVISQVACGEWHTLALGREGCVYAWELGTEPTKRIDLKGRLVKQISAGNFHSGFVTDDGQVFTYGRNSCGQLGREGEDAKVAHQVTQNIGEQYVRYLSCGDYHTTAIVDLNPRNLLCWKFLRAQRRYLTRLLMIMDYYAKNFDTGCNMLWEEKTPEEETPLLDFKTQMTSLFGIISDLLSLQWDLMAELDSSLIDPERTERLPLGMILRSKMDAFHVYLKYADNYATSAMMLHKYLKKKCFSTFVNDQKKIVINEFGSGVKSLSKFSLPSLIFEPLKHIARYVKILKEITRQTSRRHLDKDMLSFVLERFEGLLERVCKNFTLVNPLEILRCTLNELGQPEIGMANLSQLVERLTHHQFNDVEFTSSFLLTYRYFTTPKNFLDALIKRFNSLPSRKKHDAITQEEQENILQLVQIRVAQVFSRWVKSRVSSYDFDDPESALNKEALQFLQELKKNPNCVPYLQHVEARLSKKTKRVSQSKSIFPTSPFPTADLSLMAEDNTQLTVTNFDAETIADYLTAYDFEYFKKIHPTEFLKQGWAKPNAVELSPNILAMTTRFNEIGQWVVYEVLFGNTARDRVQIILHFLAVARSIKKRNNFNGFGAILGGLNNAAITRLKKTSAKLAEEKNSGLEEMTQLIEGDDNFRTLREMWSNVEPPAIPFLAITLKDLTFLEDGNPDQLEGGGINCYKWRKIAELIQDVLEYQHVPYEPVINQSLQTYIHGKIEAAKHLGATGLFAKSKKCE